MYWLGVPTTLNTVKSKPANLIEIFRPFLNDLIGGKVAKKGLFYDDTSQIYEIVSLENNALFLPSTHPDVKL